MTSEAKVSFEKSIRFTRVLKSVKNGSDVIKNLDKINPNHDQSLILQHYDVQPTKAMAEAMDEGYGLQDHHV